MVKGNKGKIDNLGRIVIPKSIRNALGINHNDEISMTVENDKLIISVKAHSASNYMDYVKVIDQLKQANATRISIAESGWWK